MALKVDYVLKETGRNLIRNLLLSIATVVVVIVAVALVGGSLLVRQAVGNATERWRGRHRVHRLHEPRRRPGPDRRRRLRALDEAPQVDELSSTSTRTPPSQEYKDIFEEDSPELIEASSRRPTCPRRSRSKPVNPEREVVDSLVRQFGQQAGVYKVIAATDAIRSIERISNILSVGMAIVALALHRRRACCSSASPSRRPCSPGGGRSRS